MNIKRRILELLKEGFSQHEIADILKAEGFHPNSLSSVEKKLRQIKEEYEAKTLFHLAVLLIKDEYFTL
ncbi:MULTISPECIES: hypothetical protein [Chryseobacterium]|uniref:HTH luxR-type domain-containing protein n=1 Tax=Candidatus Chryseobacterium massiliense TaxID=204089 RepID=A0A3D9B3G4_9FLAO|nr:MULTISPECIES: hypothetical protein [Chryseobacterium]REC47887.1 hypothetical protein DRF68_12660 [Candidatus Chryseobacterium massiliae]